MGRLGLGLGSFGLGLCTMQPQRSHLSQVGWAGLLHHPAKNNEELLPPKCLGEPALSLHAVAVSPERQAGISGGTCTISTFVAQCSAHSPHYQHPLPLQAGISCGTFTISNTIIAC
jgi:hypothetical protein